MPKRKTDEQKRQTVLQKKYLLERIEIRRQEITSIQQSWRIKKINVNGIKTQVPIIPQTQEIKRRGLKYLLTLLELADNTLQKVITKREDIVRNNNLKLSESGRRDVIVRPSGLVYQSNIPIPNQELGVMAWKEMLQNQRPDQIIKVVVEKSDETREQMNLEDFIDFIEEYETSFNKAVSISSYSIGFGGGCATKNDAQIIHFEIDEWCFTCKTVVTKDNDCIFAVLSKFAGKKKTGKVVRKDLGFEFGALIQVEDLQKLANYFNVNILLYFSDGEQVRQIDFKCEQDTQIVATILLYKNHYYYVQKVITPQLFSRQTKFDQYLKKTIFKADSSNFELKTEDDFTDFDQIAQYIVESDKHIFIHGSGGVGKSYLCTLVRQLYDQMGKRITITSSTGKSAIQIDGVTIHSALIKNQKKGFNYDVVIDEISMVCGDLFDQVIQSQEMGSVRLIMIGDLKQLSPVKLYENGGYFFESALYERIHDNMTRIELTKVKRTNDPEFIKIQQRVRNCDYSQDVYDYLQQVAIPEFYIDEDEIRPQPDEIIMACNNKNVDRYNGQYLNQFVVSGAQKLEFSQVQKIDMEALKEALNNDEQQIKQYIAKNTLQYRLANKKQVFYVGERVMLRCNKLKDGLCNGSIGTIQAVNQEKRIVTVLFDNGKNAVIEAVCKYKNGNAILYSEKIPLVCAYAMTIHKAQGLTISSKVFLDLQGVFESQMIYVGISRVTDFKLLRIKNLPSLKVLQSDDRFKQDVTILQYLDENVYESQAFKMLIDDHRKQMYISKFQPLDMIDQDTIYFDFETAELEKNGIIRHQPYYNHITHFKDKKLVDQTTLKDFGQDACQDVAQETFNYVMDRIKSYEEEYLLIKGLNDRKLISQKKKLMPTIVTFNGGGFDLYFLLEKLLATNGYSSQYEIRTTFKGNNLVIFQVYSLKCKLIVLRSFDICQITNSTLDTSLKSFCPQVAQKIDFKREIIYLAQNRYKNPEILNGQIHRVTAEQIVKIVDSNTIQFINRGGDQKECGWQIVEQDLERFKTLQLDPNNFQRCYQTKVYKDINLKQQLDEYAKNDTEVLQPLLHAIDKICFDELGCSILNFNTTGQVCWYGFMQNTPKELLAELRYDQNKNDKLRKINGNLKTHLYACEMEEQQFCLESIIGGKTCPRQKELVPVLDPITNQFIGYVYLDISGMYCDLMIMFDYPYGHKRWLREDEMKSLLDKLQTQIPQYDITKLIKIKDAVINLLKDKFTNLFIARVEIEENPLSVEPVITYKHKIGGTDDKPIYKSMYTNQRRIQTLTSIDIFTILLKGGKIHSIQKCLVFEKKGAILRDWMIKCLAIKNEGKRKKLPAMTSFGKVLSNGTYGQTQKQDRHSVTMFVNNTWDSDSFLEKYKLKNIFITDSDTDIIIGSKLLNKEEYVTSRCSYIGSFVLAYSRLIIQDICQHLNPEQDPEKQPLYGDTDSLLCREDLVRDRLIPAGYVQARSGKLADELADTLEKQFWFPKTQPKYYNDRLKEFTNKDDPEAYPDEQTWKEICDQSNYKFVTVTKGTFVQPKTIAILYKDPDQPDDWHEKIRAKGIPLNSKYNENGECMSYKLFMDLFDKAQQNQDIIDEQIQFKISELMQETVDEETKTKIKKSVLKTVQRGEQLELPNGLKVLTPNLINGQYNQLGEQSQNVKKNEALYKIVPNQMTRRIFNTEYKGRVVSKKNSNIYLPFSHPDTI